MTDLGRFRYHLYTLLRDDFHARPNLPDKATLQACFDAFGTRWAAAQSPIRAAVEAALGFSLTNDQAKLIAKAWMLTEIEALQ